MEKLGVLGMQATHLARKTLSTASLVKVHGWGKPYVINCPDTGEHTAKAWRHAWLEIHREGKEQEG
jgi:hypothetical protein